MCCLRCGESLGRGGGGSTVGGRPNVVLIGFKSLWACGVYHVAFVMGKMFLPPLYEYVEALGKGARLLSRVGGVEGALQCGGATVLLLRALIVVVHAESCRLFHLFLAGYGGNFVVRNVF